MADRLAAATGDLNNAYIPPWKPYGDAQRNVMLFDNDTRQEVDPRAEIRAWWDANPPPTGRG